MTWREARGRVEVSKLRAANLFGGVGPKSVLEGPLSARCSTATTVGASTRLREGFTRGSSFANVVRCLE